MAAKMEEDTQQRITYLLQEIDANICSAHRSATQICTTVRRHHQILKQIHEATQVWKPLFESFAYQPVVRRPPPTPAASTYARSTPGSRATTGKSRRNRGGDGSDYDELDDEYEDDEESIVVGEQLFKTTTLAQHLERSVNESFNVSIASDNLPQMTRTSYMPTPAYRQNGNAHDVSSSINTEERSNWSPAMSSPIRTGVLKSNQRQGGERRIMTPDSAISSVAHNSPISKNLMKMGAFEFTPPKGGKSNNKSRESQEQEESATPSTPEMPTFATLDAEVTLGAQSPARTPTADRRAGSPMGLSSASHRKRKRLQSPESKLSTAYPMTHYPVNPNKLSPGFSSPKWKSPGSFSSLRRKYSTGVPDYSTPTKFRSLESRASIEASVARATQDLMADEDPVTPPFDLASPLLRTQLKAMTPHTPLSNRLVGANLDIGTMSQESKLQDYDDSFNAGEPAPQFEIALFPVAFQSVDQLAEKLPDYGKEKIEILLDTLVSRRLLRPFVVEGTMFWQIPV
uniref:Uncharacterized protein n=1 Tax=Globisporangium ultimum (strain ATCC 200006 / CBS 805.95 / DAOM BR144) TaxID=431595 RepID=K3X262_GLOUD